MMDSSNFKKKVRIADYYVLTTYGILLISEFILFNKIDNPIINIIEITLALFIFLLLINYDNKKKPIISILRNLYYMGIIFLAYDQVQMLITIVNPIDYDDILIYWDRVLLGLDVSVIFNKIANPYLTEYMQIAYSSFYLWFVIIGIEFYRNKELSFDLYARNILFAFFFSFFLYFFMPAIGPRLTLYNFSNLNMELPGLYLTNFLRNVINQGGGISSSSLSPALLVNRDCMPSGHTMLSIINMFFAFKYRLKSKWLVGIFGISIIFATLYLRYHYFVDIIAGAIFAAASLLLEPRINKLFKKLLKREVTFEH